MSEEEPIEKEETNPEEEKKPDDEIIGQTLRGIAEDLGFSETEELHSLERRIFENRDNEAELLTLLAQFQILGEELTRRVEGRDFTLARVGLGIRRAAILYKCNLIQDCRNEIYDALTELDNLVHAGYPEAVPDLEKLEAFVKELKAVQELAEFCRDRWRFSEDEMSSLTASGDLNAAIATACVILLDRDPEFDEGKFLQSLAEAGLIEEESES